VRKCFYCLGAGINDSNPLAQYPANKLSEKGIGLRAESFLYGETSVQTLTEPKKNCAGTPPLVANDGRRSCGCADLGVKKRLISKEQSEGKTVSAAPLRCNESYPRRMPYSLQ
jgi:hypothetical protein